MTESHDSRATHSCECEKRPGFVDMTMATFAIATMGAGLVLPVVAAGSLIPEIWHILVGLVATLGLVVVLSDDGPTEIQKFSHAFLAYTIMILPFIVVLILYIMTGGAAPFEPASQHFVQTMIHQIWLYGGPVNLALAVVYTGGAIVAKRRSDRSLGRPA